VKKRPNNVTLGLNHAFANYLILRLLSASEKFKKSFSRGQIYIYYLLTTKVFNKSKFCVIPLGI